MFDKDFTFAESLLWVGLSTASSVLGWRGILALVWVASMAIDYFTGTLVAVKDGEWSSVKAREGLWHKGGMLFVALAAVILDILLRTVQRTGVLTFPFTYESVFMPMVMAGYVITETGSIIENAALLGAPIPAWLRKAVKIAGQAAEQAGDALSGSDSGMENRQFISAPDASESKRNGEQSTEDGT